MQNKYLANASSPPLQQSSRINRILNFSAISLVNSINRFPKPFDASPSVLSVIKFLTYISGIVGGERLCTCARLGVVLKITAPAGFHSPSGKRASAIHVFPVSKDACSATWPSFSPLQSFGKWRSTPLGNGDEGKGRIEGFGEKLYIRWSGGANSQVGL